MSLQGSTEIKYWRDLGENHDQETEAESGSPEFWILQLLHCLFEYVQLNLKCTKIVICRSIITANIANNNKATNRSSTKDNNRSEYGVRSSWFW